jgi:hypothetical protein
MKKELKKNTDKKIIESILFNVQQEKRRYLRGD